MRLSRLHHLNRKFDLVLRYKRVSWVRLGGVQAVDHAKGSHDFDDRLEHCLYWRGYEITRHQPTSMSGVRDSGRYME